MTAELPTEGLIYGVGLRSEFDYRYVGDLGGLGDFSTMWSDLAALF